MNKKPKVTIASSGQDGNIFFILAKVREVLRKDQRITDYNNLRDDVMKCGSYEDAIARIRQDVDLVDTDKAI